MTSVAGSSRCSGSASRLREFVGLPDLILRDEQQADPNNPRHIIADIEARTKHNKPSTSSNRTRAYELHREADALYFKGDYETALVLYHRAARLNPRETSHSVGARRAEGAIHAATNPHRRMKRVVQEQGRALGSEQSFICPETAARKVRSIIAESTNHDKDIPRIVKYLGSRKDFWRLEGGENTPRQTRSRLLERKLNRYVRTTYKSLLSAYNLGDAMTLHKLGGEIVSLVGMMEKPQRCQLDACVFVATKLLSIGRHDLAFNFATKAIFLARCVGDPILLVETLQTLGTTHIKFGHLHALCRAWQRFIPDLDSVPIAQSWLYHEIGRCHFEIGDYAKALENAECSLKQSVAANSYKWQIRSRLLMGQSFLKLGSLPEAISALKLVAKLSTNEAAENGSIVFYVQSLMDQVTNLLRSANPEGQLELRCRESANESSASEDEEGNLQVQVIHAPKSERASLVETEEQTKSETPVMQRSSACIGDGIAQLLEKARAMRRRQDSTVLVPEIALSGQGEAPGATAAEESALDTTRTRIIRRGGEHSDGENSVCSSEVIPLSQFSFTGSVFLGDENLSSVFGDTETDGDLSAQSGGPAPLAAARDLDREHRLTARSLDSAHTSDSRARSQLRASWGRTTALARKSSVPSWPQATDKDRLSPQRTLSFTDYLRSLESREVLKQERQFLEDRLGTES